MLKEKTSNYTISTILISIGTTSLHCSFFIFYYIYVYYNQLVNSFTRLLVNY